MHERLLGAGAAETLPRANHPEGGCANRSRRPCRLARGRGSGKEPGEFRRSQNWIGGTRPGNAVFVPPPHVEIAECIAALEGFIHQETHALPLLIRAALAHVQFETIHPFLDGNGRVGRLLITRLLCDGGALSEPLLYR